MNITSSRLVQERPQRGPPGWLDPAACHAQRVPHPCGPVRVGFIGLTPRWLVRRERRDLGQRQKPRP